MSSLWARVTLRTTQHARSNFKLGSKNIKVREYQLFTSKGNVSAPSMASRSWLIRKSNVITLINSRKFSIFFAAREEKKSGSCCHNNHNPTSPRQVEQSPTTEIGKNHMEHTHKHRTPSPAELAFWQDKTVWRRASSNTLRCLIGCSVGDFSAMFYLQAHHTGLPFMAMMAIPMASGIATSLGFETLVLRIKEKMSWNQSLKTAWTMSLISMLTMEFVENIVDMYLTKGMMNFHDPYFWLALVPSLLAGFLAPLPYNYYKLKKFGKSCH